MKKFALLGGIGPESTIAYYRQVINRYQALTGTTAYPDFLIKSIDMNEMLGYVFQDQYDKLVSFLTSRLAELDQSSIDFAAIASNTPHIVFDQLTERCTIPLISIVDSACEAARKKGLMKLGLFGTRSTMTHGFYQKTATCFGINIITPNDEDMEYIHEKYMNELIYKNIQSDTRKKLIDIASSLREQHKIEGLILGGTELSLILQQNDIPDLELLDTTQLHVEAIVKEMIST